MTQRNNNYHWPIFFVAYFFSSIEFIFAASSHDCPSQGNWTSKAIEQSSKLKALFETLQDDPNCKSILAVRVLPSEDVQDSFLVKKSQEESSASYDHDSLTTSLLGSLTQDESSGFMNALLLNKIKGAAQKGYDKFKTNWEGTAANAADFDRNQKASHAFRSGLDGLEKLLDVLPSNKQCFLNRPSQLGQLVSHIIGLMASYSSSDDKSSLFKISGLMNKFVNYLREMKYENAKYKINNIELETQIACILEATSENYCRTLDAINLIDLSKSKIELFGRAIEPSESMKLNPEQNLNNIYKMLSDGLKSNHEANLQADAEGDYHPLEGYYLLSRDTLILSDWLQKVMFGVVPRTLADAAQKNTVISNVQRFLQDENTLYGIYEMYYVDFLGVKEEKADARRALLLDLVKKLSGTMTGRSMGGDGSEVNFFTRLMMPDKLTFYLIGIDGIPVEVGTGTMNRPPIDKYKYIENNGAYIAQFQDPKALLEKIKTQLTDTIDQAKQLASSYFSDRLVVDKEDLVAKSLVSQTISVYQSIQRIDRYLAKLERRIIRENKAADNFYGSYLESDVVNEKAKHYLEYSDALGHLFTFVKNYEIKNPDAISGKYMEDPEYKELNFAVEQKQIELDRSRPSLQTRMNLTSAREKLLVLRQHEIDEMKENDIVKKITNGPTCQRESRIGGQTNQTELMNCIYREVEKTIEKIEGIINLKNEIAQLEVRLSDQLREEDKRESSQVIDFGILPNLQTTRASLGRIISAYKTVFKKVGHYINELKFSVETQDPVSVKEINERIIQNADISKLLVNIIETVYYEFNVIKQRDTYILSRMDTFVRYDFMRFTKNNPKLTNYQRDLLTMAGNDLVSELTEALTMNPANGRIDLNRSLGVTLTTIAAIEEIFADKFYSVMAGHDRTVTEKGNKYIDQEIDAWKRLIHNSNSKESLKRLAAKRNFSGWRWVYENTFNFSFESFLHPDRYVNDAPLFNNVTIDYDTNKGSFNSMLSVDCALSLMFEESYYIFYPLCSDTLLEGESFSSVDKETPHLGRLTSHYDDIFQKFVNADLDNDSKLKKIYRDQKICHLRNYRRKNNAYILTEKLLSP